MKKEIVKQLENLHMNHYVTVEEIYNQGYIDAINEFARIAKSNLKGKNVCDCVDSIREDMLEND